MLDVWLLDFQTINCHIDPPYFVYSYPSSI